jgi:hypothetical protein
MLMTLSACVETRSVALTFGEGGEGLDGFMCRTGNASDGGVQLLSRMAPDTPASLVIDFVTLGGVPGCRTGQMISWCRTHTCKPIGNKRECVSVKLPGPNDNRLELRTALNDAIRKSGARVSDTPDEFVLVRVVGTTQSCDDLEKVNENGDPAEFDKSLLLGCAYSCPVLLDQIEQDVYLGFETFQDTCEQGVKTCSDGELHWQP